MERSDGPFEGIFITGMKILPGASGPIVPLALTTPRLYGLPTVPPSANGCNCTSFLPSNKLLVTPPSASVKTVDDCDCDNNDTSDDGLHTQMSALSMSDPTDSETMFTISFRISGSTWEERFQTALKGCRKLLTTANSLPVDLVFETDNPVDVNAVRVDYSGQCLGYVGKCNIPRIHDAIKSEQITTASLVQVCFYLAPSGNRYLLGRLSVSKKGKWVDECSNYVYNQHLQ
jgi:hypothetical protein